MPKPACPPRGGQAPNLSHIADGCNMTKEIAGMTYAREPATGEIITVRLRECGNFISAEVLANGELIAFDSIPKPSKPEREDASRGRREALIQRAAQHWTAHGFDVEGV